MKCPGQDSRYWRPGAIFEAECPECGHIVEFFKDDTSIKTKAQSLLQATIDTGGKDNISIVIAEL